MLAPCGTARKGRGAREDWLGIPERKTYKSGVKMYLWIALGSGLGGMARHALGTWIMARMAGAFPWGTMAVNVAGCLVIGMLAGETKGLGPTARQFATVGFLGGFTTFSAFSLQAVTLALGGKPGMAAAYVIASVALCLGATWAGMMLVK